MNKPLELMLDLLVRLKVVSYVLCQGLILVFDGFQGRIQEIYVEKLETIIDEMMKCKT